MDLQHPALLVMMCFFVCLCVCFGGGGVSLENGNKTENVRSLHISENVNTISVMPAEINTASPEEDGRKCRIT